MPPHRFPIGSIAHGTLECHPIVVPWLHAACHSTGKNPSGYALLSMESRDRIPPESDDPAATRSSLIRRLRDWDDQTGWEEFFDTYWKLIYAVAINRTFSTRELKTRKVLVIKVRFSKVCPQLVVGSGVSNVPVEVICGGACGGSWSLSCSRSMAWSGSGFVYRRKTSLRPSVVGK